MDLIRVWRVRWLIVLATTLWVGGVLSAAAGLDFADRDGDRSADPLRWLAALAVLLGATTLLAVTIWWAVVLLGRGQDRSDAQPFNRITISLVVAIIALELGLGLWVGSVGFMFAFDHNSLTAPLGMHELFAATYEPLAGCGLLLGGFATVLLVTFGLFTAWRAIVRRFSRS